MKSFRAIFTISAILSVACAADSGTAVAVVAPSAGVASQTRRLDDEEPWDVGTKVYNNFPNEGWWSGTITSYNPDSAMYTVTWEDGSNDYYDDGDKIDEMVAYAQNDPQNNPAGSESTSGTYPAGTTVSVFEEGTWYDGTIIQFGSGTYTVQWDEDDEIEEIQQGPVMDQMVMDANGDDDAAPAGFEGGPVAANAVGDIAVGTPVSYYSDGEWTDGEIIDFSVGTYVVQWTDGTTDEYSAEGSDLDELKQAVQDANGDDDAPPSDATYTDGSGPSFDTGSPVSDYEDGEWVDGQIIDFQSGKYIVQWNDEDDVEYYDSASAEDMQELTKMTQDSDGDDDAPPASFFADQDLWEIGTPVAVTEEDVVWYGKIDGFRQGEYSIAWDNGETEFLDNFDLVNQMVSNAAISPNNKGMGAAGKVFLSLFIISVCVVGSAFGYKFYEKQQEQKKRERELASEDGPSYRDTPDHLPKII
mmetsp:Transcript_30234/g.64826  ORF Transcript_30234/g.64826 Transcript_30234/m.64826 type:complete len:472 (+) Transcript_30234:108-1523(+)